MEVRLGSAKNPRTVAGSFRGRRRALVAFFFRSFLLVTPILPMRSCLTFFYWFAMARRLRGCPM